MSGIHRAGEFNFAGWIGSDGHSIIIHGYPYELRIEPVVGRRGIKTHAHAATDAQGAGMVRGGGVRFGFDPAYRTLHGLRAFGVACCTAVLIPVDEARGHHFGIL